MTQTRPLLDRLEHNAIGTRDPDGTTHVRRSDVAGCVLYGPYWHFEAGRYRLSFRAEAKRPRFPGQPALGVEIIILSRFQRAWRDFTAGELASGAGTLVFDVPAELSADGGNEARFEFRFFHLGNADLRIAAVELERLPDHAAPEPDPRHWRLLGRLRKTWLATIGGRTAGCLYYGGWPYLRLGQGRYRLAVMGRAGSPRLPAQPVLGVEILGRSRWHTNSLLRVPKPGGSREAWADFTAAEWAGGTVSLDFAVPAALALEAGADAPFDIRLHRLGNADISIDGVELTWLGDDEGEPAAQTWRLLGRLRKARIGTETRSGIVVAAGELPGPVLSKLRPPLDLTPGCYRLSLQGAGTAGIEIGGVSATGAEASFEIPEGPDRRHELTISHLGGADLTLTGIELRREPAAQLPRAQLAGRKKLVFIGNCQCSVLVQAFNQTEALSRQFAAKYHFVQLRPNLYEFARRDIEDCDILAVQDIDLWNHFPLRDCVRPATEVIKFPLMRFASLWPFDAWNGPGDREAHDREAPNSTFPFLDGVLARLRHEIPDQTERLRAYRSLDGIGVVNYRRIHALEERRLLKIDRQYDCRIGEFTLENFRTRQVFHTTVRPNWQGFNLLIRMILKAIGIADPVDPLTQSADSYLRIPQVPIHPKVAQDLGVKWADDATRYLVFGQQLTWEAYTRRYIEHYG